MSTFKELLQLRRDDEFFLALAPVGHARVGDFAMIDGELFKVEKTEWIDSQSAVCHMIMDSSNFVTPDMILRVQWKKEAPDADS